MSLIEIVNVQVNVESVAVSRQAFGIPLFLGFHKVFTERFRIYTGVQGLLDDGFDPDSDEVTVATAVFSQNIVPEQLYIGRRQTDDVTSITANPVADNTNYTVTINGTDFTIDSGAGATATSIATALFVAINAGSEPVTATDNTGSISLSPDVAGVDYSLTTSVNLDVVLDIAGADTLAVAIQDIRNVDDRWYALMTHTHLIADITTVATIIQALKKIYAYSTDEAAAITTSTSDIFSILSALNFDRTIGLFDPDADTAFPEAAWLGVMLPKDPGSATWAFKTLVGQDTDTLTPTESSNARGKNGNTYETIGGVDITRFGTTAEGEFMDITRGVDFLESRLTERIFSKLVAADKIPFTEEGVAIIEAEIRAQLRESITQGIIAETPEFVITTPVVLDISAVVKATRQLPTITFTATLQGAIHKVTVVGSVTV